MTDWESVLAIVCVTLLFVLFLGEPDIQDAIVHAIMENC